MIKRKFNKFKSFFKKIKIAFIRNNKNILDFRKINAISFKSFVVNDREEFNSIIRNVSAGRYCIRIAHRNDKLFNTRKGLIAAFDLSGSNNIESKKTKLGLYKSSEKYGVFEYLGGGIEKEDFYIQDMYLEITSNIDFLQIKIHSLISHELLYIESLQIFDAFLPEKSITTIKGGDKVDLSDSLDKEINLSQLENIVLNKDLSNVDVLIYADISPNVIDGSSIWLTSIINILSLDHQVLVLFKNNINKDKNVLSNIINESYKYLEPKELGILGPLNNHLAVDILQNLDKEIPSIRAVVTRGYDLALTVQRDDTFIGRRLVYLTDFYSVSDQGFYIPDNRKKTLQSVVSNADYLLVQTEKIKDKLEELTKSKLKTISLPPTLPNNLDSFLVAPNISLDSGVVNIGYAGKVQPRWGVEELLEWSERLRLKGARIHLHIATGKIYSSNKKDGFVKKINQLLDNHNVTLYSGLDRFGAMSLMNEMDFVWCYRSDLLEDSTLEVSTKLIEMAALGKPSICYPSGINKQLLGKDYSCFIENFDGFQKLILDSNSLSFNFEILAKKIQIEHSFDSIAKNFNLLTNSNSSAQKILIAGHDLKFINPWISFLKQKGYQVKVDEWEWGKAYDLDRSRKLLEWADIIFCEWGLANAVWYSQNNIHKKPLYIRAHAQEVRDKARKFGQQIVMDNVTQVIFVAEHIRQKALELWSWPETKTTIIPNFLLTEKFSLRSSSLKLNLGMVGIIPQTKRFDRAIDLLEKLVLEGKDAHLYLKGHRPEDLPFMYAPGRKKELEYYDKLYQRIKKSPSLKKRVHFDGWGNNVAEWYQNIDFILSPSDAESFHYALADGVLSGCIPIVWNWEYSDAIYPESWIVKSEEEIIERIELFTKHKDQEINEYRKVARDSLIERYSEINIFNKINSLIFK